MMIHTELRTSIVLIAFGTAFLSVVLFDFAKADNDFYHTRDGLHTPCSFFDTVNITDDRRFDNGSYEHNGIIIPPHLVGSYDYILMDHETRINVKPHYRGCICKLKPCITFCCPWGLMFNSTSNRCEENNEHKWPLPVLNITYTDGSEKPTDIFQHFEIQHFRPCQSMYALFYFYDDFQIFENGSMIRNDDNVFLYKSQYCFLPIVNNETDEYYSINPANCYRSTEYTTMKIVNAYAMLFSIPFMFLTIVVYLSIPELRNQHGKSLVCYLTGLTIGYSLLVCISLQSDKDISDTGCAVIGFTAYYFFMAAFLWLSVISFDLWHNFRGTRGANRFHEKKRFLFYSLYAWGLAALFLLFTYVAQTYLDIPNSYKPGIAGGDFCWLDMRTWSAMIYFFGPVLVIILINTMMFVMTALKIHKVQREMARIMARDDSTKNLRTEKDKFGLFLRLFIVMGVTWSLEIISYFAGNNKFWSKMFYATDICNAIQGFLIFMLFVMKKKVKHLITNRYTSISGNSNQRQSQYSTKTTSSMMISNATNSTGSSKYQSEKPLVSGDHRTTSLRD